MDHTPLHSIDTDLVLGQEYREAEDDLILVEQEIETIDLEAVGDKQVSVVGYDLHLILYTTLIAG